LPRDGHIALIQAPVNQQRLDSQPSQFLFELDLGTKSGSVVDQNCDTGAHNAGQSVNGDSVDGGGEGGVAAQGECGRGRHRERGGGGGEDDFVRGGLEADAVVQPQAALRRADAVDRLGALQRCNYVSRFGAR